MAYQSRKRNYKSRRERYERDKRNIGIIAVFVILAAIVLFVKNRHDILFYLKSYFN